MDKQRYTYALLDCSAHDSAWHELTTLHPQARWKSLFDGTPEQELHTAAPLLIAFTQEDKELVAWLGGLERMQPSVSWIESPHTLGTLAPMLARRLPCEIDDGREVVLRYYDPRILLGLPSALTPQQKRYFFAPVAAWTAWEPRREAYYGIEAEPATAADMARYAFSPISLTLAQRDQLMYFDKENLYDSIVTHWQETCPDDIDGLSAPILREIAMAAVSRCGGYGIHDPGALHLFAGLMMTVSPSFDDHPAVKAHLVDTALAPEHRIGAMIGSLPDHVWDQIVQDKRMDALFEHAPSPVLPGNLS
jgi:hypothetical protein